MFLRNVWYVAGWSSDLASGKLLGRRVLDEPIVLSRTASGAAFALEDRCVHRGMPLSLGECDGNIIRCGYHGLEFDASGICTKIPGQDTVPRQASVRSYPLVEQDGFLWIWMGSPEQADPATIFRYPYFDDSVWASGRIFLEIDANWQLFHDNLLDLTHVALVHRRTLGGDSDAHAKAEMITKRDGNRVLVTRWLLKSPPPLFYREAGNFRGDIDRWHEIAFQPSQIDLYIGATDAGTGAYEGRRDGGVHLRTLHAITPETKDRTLYFFTQARNFRVTDEELSKKLGELNHLTFLEDKAVLEAQHARLAEDPDRSLLAIRADAGAAIARQIVRELYDVERRALAGIV